MVTRGSRAAAEVASVSSPGSGVPDASQHCSLPNPFPPASLGLGHVWGLAADVDRTLHTVGAQQTQTLWRVSQGDPALRRGGGLLTKAQKCRGSARIVSAEGETVLLNAIKHLGARCSPSVQREKSSPGEKSHQVS